MRIVVKIVARRGEHVFLSLWVNGALASTPAGICLRREEEKEFLERLKPEKIVEEEIP